MHIYFVRHAQSLGNAHGYESTENHDQLSPLGHQQAEGLAVRLQDQQFDHIYVSSCYRTLQTIAPYLRDQQRQAEIWPSLAEACWQEDLDAPIPDRSGQADRVEIPPELSEHYVIPHGMEWAPWAEETHREGSLRVELSRAEILKRHAHSDEKILLVGHFNSGSRLLEFFLGLDHSRRIEHDNTGLSCLKQHPDNTFSILFTNRL